MLTLWNHDSHWRLENALLVTLVTTHAKLASILVAHEGVR